MFKLFIIDLDGTLVDSKLDIHNSLNLTLENYNLPKVELEIVSKHVGVGITPIINEIVPKNIFLKFMKDFEKNYIANITNHTKLYEGWDSILKNTNSITKVILSNKSQKFCNPLIKKLKLTKYFNNIFGGEAFNEKKPSPLPILEISKLLGIDLESIIIIGDTSNDINSGKAANIKTCGVTYGYSTRDEIVKLSPNYVIDSPLQLLEIIK